MNNQYNLRNKIISLAPNLVASEDTTPEDYIADKENSTPSEMATFSTEQFERILTAISGNVKSGSFTQCTARFKGLMVQLLQRNLTVLKDTEKIYDSDALRVMPLLMEDYAVSWQIGVKDTVSRLFPHTKYIYWRIFFTFI